MANLISPFENEDWTLAGTGGAYVSTPTQRGSATALRMRHNTIGTNTEAQSPDMVVTAGNAFDVSFWLQWTDISHEQFKMLVSHYPNGTSMSRASIDLIRSTQFAADVWHQFKYTVTSNSTSNALYFATQLSSNSFTGSIDWFCDNVSFSDAGVAVKLAERSVSALDTQLKAQLGTELGAIDTDRADGITMAVPASGDYHQFDKQVTATGAGTPEVHIFEDQEYEFINPNHDVQRGSSAYYNLPVTLRLVWWNRDDDTRSDMETRKRRYLTGIYNVIVADHTIGSSDDAIKKVLVADTQGAARGSVTLDDGVNKLKGVVELDVVAQCGETA